MKVLKVNENCNGCGMCIMNCNYLQENDDGNAEFIIGKSISDTDMPTVSKVVEECPCNAISIVEEGITDKSGLEGAKEVIKKLKKQMDDIIVKRTDDLIFNADNFFIDFPVSAKECVVDYSSESQARSAARDEFKRLCYSESAYRPILKRLFVEYKVNILKPYYDCSDTEGNVYYNYNKQVRDMLKRAYAEIKSFIGDKIPESFTDFSVYPSSANDINIMMLEKFDNRSTNSGIIGELSSFDSYMSEVDYTDYEEYVGEGKFGRSKYKKKYQFNGLSNAISEFIKDLKFAIKLQSRDIQNSAIEIADNALKNFDKKLREEMKKKIDELERIVEG